MLSSVYSLTHYAKGTLPALLTSLETVEYKKGFKIYFTPSNRVLFTIPSRYLCTIGLEKIQGFEGWFVQSSHRKSVIQNNRSKEREESIYKGFHLLWHVLSILLITFFHLLLNALFQAFPRVLSPILSRSLVLFGLSGTEMVQFPENFSQSVIYVLKSKN